MRMYLVLVALAFGALLGVHDADALTVSPTIYEITANPGETITKAVRLKNESNVSEVLQPSTQNFIAAPEGEGKPMFIGTQPVNSLANWISVEQTRVSLAPGETKDVVFTVTVPSDAQPGGHYAAVLWTAAAGTTRGSAVGIESAVAAPMVLVNVRGDVHESAQLLNFNTKDGASKYQGLPINFAATIRNTGNVHVHPEGQIEIYNMLGKKVTGDKPVLFNSDLAGGYVLPETQRDFTATWDTSSGFTFGRYTAKLTVAYGTDGKVETGTVQFWVMPPALMFVWCVIILGVLAILVMVIKQMLMPAPKKVKAAPRKGAKK